MEGREEGRQINKLLSVSIACVAEMISLVSPPFTVMMIWIQFRIRRERGCCQAIKGMTWLLWPKVDLKFFHALRICLISSTSAKSRAPPALSKANKSRYSNGNERERGRDRESEQAVCVLYEAEQRWAKFCLRNVGQVKSVKMNAYMRRRRGHFEGLMAVGQLTAFRQASWQQIGLLFVFVKRLNLLCFGSGEQRKHYESLPALPCDPPAIVGIVILAHLLLVRQRAVRRKPG